MVLPAGYVLILQRVHADQILYVVLKGCALGKQLTSYFMGYAIIFICEGGPKQKFTLVLRKSEAGEIKFVVECREEKESE